MRRPHGRPAGLNPTHRAWLLLAAGALVLPAHAGLSLSGQFLTASALVTGPDGQTHGNTWFWDSSLNLPVQVVSSAIQHQGLAAGARQTPDGFFYDEVALDKPWEAPDGQYTLRAETHFSISVTTDEANTPLILDFNFLGSQLNGGSYYANGRMTIGSTLSIRGGLSGTARPETWQFEDRLMLDGASTGSAFVRQSNGIDLQGIGLPQVSDSAGWFQFIAQGEVQREAFVGRLDFGLLQPGQVFRLDYDASAWIDANTEYAGSARAELVDPFSLGGTPPVQLQLQGLDLPMAAVPEPATAASLLAGLALLLAVRRRRG